MVCVFPRRGFLIWAFFLCSFYQVLACDPEDMMIAEGSSTKAGVSVMVELGAQPSSLDVYEPPKVR